jgi:hypothetical protein
MVVNGIVNFSRYISPEISALYFTPRVAAPGLAELRRHVLIFAADRRPF